MSFLSLLSHPSNSKKYFQSKSYSIRLSSPKEFQLQSDYNGSNKDDNENQFYQIEQSNESSNTKSNINRNININPTIIKQIGNYRLGPEIGSGAFGIVVIGTHIPTGEPVAIKILDKFILSSTPEDYELVKQELSILKIVKHKYIVRLYEILETPRHIFIIMEYCEGKEMMEYILSQDHLSEEESQKFFRQLINALLYLHSQNITHRDIKIDNLLLDKNKNLKIIDFGLSTKYSDNKLLKQPCGTVAYAPPEILRCEKYHGMLVDVWSSGIVLYGMLSGYLPYGEQDDEKNKKLVLENDIDYSNGEIFNSDVKDLLEHMLEKDPLKRFTLTEILEHKWFSKELNKNEQNDNFQNFALIPGIVIGRNNIPLDTEIVNACEQYGSKRENVEKSVLENKFNKDSALYYLLVNKLKYKGKDSVSDLCSNIFIDYIEKENKKNIIKEKHQNKNEIDDIYYDIGDGNNSNSNTNSKKIYNGKKWWWDSSNSYNSPPLISSEAKNKSKEKNSKVKRDFRSNKEKEENSEEEDSDNKKLNRKIIFNSNLKEDKYDKTYMNENIDNYSNEKKINIDIISPFNDGKDYSFSIKNLIIESNKKSNTKNNKKNYDIDDNVNYNYNFNNDIIDNNDKFNSNSKSKSSSSLLESNKTIKYCEISLKDLKCQKDEKENENENNYSLMSFHYNTNENTISHNNKDNNSIYIECTKEKSKIKENKYLDKRNKTKEFPIKKKNGQIIFQKIKAVGENTKTRNTRVNYSLIATANENFNTTNYFYNNNNNKNNSVSRNSMNSKKKKITGDSKTKTININKYDKFDKINYFHKRKNTEELKMKIIFENNLTNLNNKNKVILKKSIEEKIKMRMKKDFEKKNKNQIKKINKLNITEINNNSNSNNIKTNEKKIIRNSIDNNSKNQSKNKTISELVEGNKENININMNTNNDYYIHKHLRTSFIFPVYQQEQQKEINIKSEELTTTNRKTSQKIKPKAKVKTKPFCLNLNCPNNKTTSNKIKQDIINSNNSNYNFNKENINTNNILINKINPNSDRRFKKDKQKNLNLKNNYNTIESNNNNNNQKGGKILNKKILNKLALFTEESLKKKISNKIKMISNNNNNSNNNQEKNKNTIIRTSIIKSNNNNNNKKNNSTSNRKTYQRNTIIKNNNNKHPNINLSLSSTRKKSTAKKIISKRYKNYLESSVNISRNNKSPIVIKDLSYSPKQNYLNEKTRNTRIPWKIKKKGIDENILLDTIYQKYLDKIRMNNPFKKRKINKSKNKDNIINDKKALYKKKIVNRNNNNRNYSNRNTITVLNNSCLFKSHIRNNTEEILLTINNLNHSLNKKKDDMSKNSTKDKLYNNTNKDMFYSHFQRIQKHKINIMNKNKSNYNNNFLCFSSQSRNKSHNYSINTSSLSNITNFTNNNELRKSSVNNYNNKVNSTFFNSNNNNNYIKNSIILNATNTKINNNYNLINISSSKKQNTLLKSRQKFLKHRIIINQIAKNLSIDSLVSYKDTTDEEKLKKNSNKVIIDNKNKFESPFDLSGLFYGEKNLKDTMNNFCKKLKKNGIIFVQRKNRFLCIKYGSNCQIEIEKFFENNNNNHNKEFKKQLFCIRICHKKDKKMINKIYSKILENPI